MGHIRGEAGELRTRDPDPPGSRTVAPHKVVTGFDKQTASSHKAAAGFDKLAADLHRQSARGGGLRSLLWVEAAHKRSGLGSPSEPGSYDWGGKRILEGGQAGPCPQ